MSDRITNITVPLLLFIMFLLAFFSMKADSLTFDELAHIPAGYSYLTQKDYRLNPEHPPLVKDISALPLLFLNLNFLKQDPVWLQENEAPAWWVQFDVGTKFLYYSGNNPQEIIFWSRLPMIFLLLLLGWLIFKWTREIGGNKTGLLALALFSFSPLFIANGRLVTTDVGAAFGAVFAAYFWLKFLKDPKKLNVFLAGIAFAIAMLLKFSLILLIPFFGILTIIYPLLYFPQERYKKLLRYLFLAAIAGLIGFLFVVWPIYQFHIWNYPASHQVRDTAADLAPNKLTPLKNAVIWMADKPFLRPFAQYFRGVLMASQRTVFGNTVYFLGNISASGWRYYFPVIYFFKTPLAFHLLTFLALMGLFICLKKQKISLQLLKDNFVIFSFFLFIIIYLGAAMMGKLNIGIRHLLPILPFIIILVSLGTIKLVKEIKIPLAKKILIGTASFFIGWYVSSSLAVFPYYLSYYNELAGGTKNGYKIAVDSNYDWGQDFYRLLDFVERNNINKIYLDYFGGENPEYWLGEKYVKLDPKKVAEDLSKGLALSEAGGGVEGWVAVSLNQLMGGIAKPVPNFDQQIGYYQWLQNRDPVAKIGYSIFVYKID